MNIYFIERKFAPGSAIPWEEDLAHVIVAKDPAQAKRIARQQSEGDGAKRDFHEMGKHRLWQVGVADERYKKPKIILTSNAGS